MLDRPPREREALSWLAVVLGSLLVLVTIPLARTLQQLVQDHAGRESFLAIVYATLALAAVLALRRVRHLPRGRGAAAAWLLATAGVFGAYTFALRGAPEEALHFVEYGALGILAYRALSHRLRDASIYVCAALLGAIVGLLDEALQWLTPQRYWDLRDVWLNTLAAALAQVGLALGLRPTLVARRPGAAGLRLACRLALVALALLGASLLNTPPRVAWYAARVPGLDFLLRGESMMLEYGHLVEDPEIGRFRSRFPPEALRALDARRGRAAAALLDRSRDPADYAGFLERYTPVTDPFLHEARVHLFRRDRALERARAEPDRAAEHRAVARGEQRILELYFPRALASSAYGLDAETRSRLEQDAAPETFESAVSAELVTRVGETGVAAGLGLALAALALAQHALGRKTS